MNKIGTLWHSHTRENVLILLSKVRCECDAKCRMTLYRVIFDNGTICDLDEDDLSHYTILEPAGRSSGRDTNL